MMTQVTKNNNQNLLEILVAVAWLDGEIQPEEKKLLEKIAAEKDFKSPEEVQNLLAQNQTTSTEQCYELLREYLGTKPNPEDYQNLLSAVSALIYSDDNIDTAEASLLTKIQNLDPHNLSSPSALDRLLNKIKTIYQAGLSAV